MILIFECETRPIKIASLPNLRQSKRLANVRWAIKLKAINWQALSNEFSTDFSNYLKSAHEIRIDRYSTMEKKNEQNRY